MVPYPLQNWFPIVLSDWQDQEIKQRNFQTRVDKKTISSEKSIFKGIEGDDQGILNSLTLDHIYIYI